MSSTDEKLDRIIGEMQLLRAHTEEIARLVNRVSVLETTVKDQATSIFNLKCEIRILKDSNNARDQQERCNSLRLFNFPGSDSETGLLNNVYDKVIKPLLVAAKASNLIPSVPQVGNTLSAAFRIGRFSPGSNKPPPPHHPQVCLAAGAHGGPQEQAPPHAPHPGGGVEAHGHH